MHTLFYRSNSGTIAAQLTEVLRCTTDLSYDKCRTGVVAVLECLINSGVASSQLPAICQAVEQVLVHCVVLLYCVELVYCASVLYCTCVLC